MVLGMLFENFKNVHILRYVIYEFLKKVLGGPRPTCLVRVHCALWQRWLGEHLSQILVLTDHGSPVFGLDRLEAREPGVV